MMNPEDMPNNDLMDPADKEKAIDMMIFRINNNIDRLYNEIEINRKNCEENTRKWQLMEISIQALSLE